MTYRFLWGFCLAVGILYAIPTHAAKLMLISGTPTAEVGKPFTATLAVDSEGASINAAQASLVFDPQSLEVIQADTTDSIFRFWLQEPVFSNDKGTLSFIGGSVEGFSGKSLRLLTLVVKAKKAGQITLGFTEGAVNASDGSGANILSALNDLYFMSSTSSALSVGGAVQQIVRKATPSGSLPERPIITIPLYPDPQKWYGQRSPFLVRWNLPPDVSAVSAVLNQDPNTASKEPQGLFDNKTFTIPHDGIWYIHVRFRNDLGWGEAAHYRLAIDTIPPVAFKIQIVEGETTDEPRPTITFETGDPITEIKEYGIRVDNGNVFFTKDNHYRLPLLKPGKHRITVRIADQAENTTESYAEIIVQPLPPPTVTLAASEYVLGKQEHFHLLGTGLPGKHIQLSLKNEAGQYVEFYETTVDRNGNWSFTHEHLPSKGTYRIEAIQEDERGATSLPIETETIIVRDAWDILPFSLSTTVILLSIAFISLLLGVLFGRLSRRAKISYRQNPRLVQSEFKALLKEMREDLNALHRHMRSAEKKQLIDKLILSLNKIHHRLDAWRDRLE